MSGLVHSFWLLKWINGYLRLYKGLQHYILCINSWSEILLLYCLGLICVFSIHIIKSNTVPTKCREGNGFGIFETNTQKQSKKPAILASPWLHSTERDRSSYVRIEKRKLDREVQTLPAFTSTHLASCMECEVRNIVGLSVSDSDGVSPILP